jgi:hypothetical protein
VVNISTTCFNILKFWILTIKCIYIVKEYDHLLGNGSVNMPKRRNSTRNGSHLLGNGWLTPVSAATNINEDITATTTIKECNLLFDMVTYIRAAWQL